jgi:hypothetical protein
MEGERERARNQVHMLVTVSRRRGNGWSRGAASAPLFPIGRMQCGQCLNTDLGHCSTGPGPIRYPTVFLFFKLTQFCKIPK